MSGQFAGPMQTLEAVLAVVLDFAIEAVPGGEGDEAAHATSAPLMLGAAEFGEARIAALAHPLAQIQRFFAVCLYALKAEGGVEGLIGTLMALRAGRAAEEVAKSAIINIRVDILAKFARELTLITCTSLKATRLHFIGHLKQLYSCIKRPRSTNPAAVRRRASFCCWGLQVEIELFGFARQQILFMRRISLVVVALMLSLCVAQTDIFSKYYSECRKIAEAMTLNQKVGQMIQLDFKAITNQERETTNPDEAVALELGSLLISADAAPTENGNLARIPIETEYDKHMSAFRKGNVTNWKKLTERFQNLGVTVATKDSGKYKIKFLLGSDAIRGDQHTVGSILFPHNIGLSCSKNEAHFENMGFWTKQAMKKSGFNFAFSPTVAVSHNPQWGRYYESLGQDESWIEKYSQAYVRGAQEVSSGRINGVLATNKHYLGDGSTLYGCNMGNSNIQNFKNYLSRNTRGYYGGVKENVGSVMVSYSAINWIPNSLNSHFLLANLREDIGFSGFTISDYDDLQFNTNNWLLPRTFMNFTAEEDAYSAMLNAGVDMFMLSKKATAERLFKHAKRNTERNYVPESRLTDAVTRILSVKMAMGLVEKVQQQPQATMIEEEKEEEVKYPSVSSGNEYQDSLNAVRQSLVLLKNANTLPARGLLSSIKYVVLIGEKIHNVNRLTRIQLFRNFDNIGMQCGGWTVRWQGVEGNQFWTGDLKTRSNASSVLDALRALQGKNNFELIYPNYTNINNELTIEQERTKFISDLKLKRKDLNSRNTLVIGTFGEFPYAESTGDVNIPYCKSEDTRGCLYNPVSNPYAPGSQLRTLKTDFAKFDSEVLTTLREQDKNIPLVSVLLSGRPMLVEDLLASSNAVIAAWLPGTSGGQGIVDAIVGDYIIRPKSASSRNTLSMDWPADMASLENFPIYGADGAVPKINSPLFPAGFGLSTDNTGFLHREQ